MLHSVLLATSDNVEAAGFILRGIKGIFVAIGSVIAAIVCGVIAATKGRSAIGWGLARSLLQHHHPHRGDRDPQQEELTFANA